MSQNLRYREQIDACRPGTGDLSLPALAELAQAVKSDAAIAEELARSERFDHAVSAAMHDVPLPAGLLERLEAKLATADFAGVAESTGEKVVLPPAPSHKSRRYVLVGTGLATAAAILLAVASQFWSPVPRSVSRAQLTSDVSQWIADNAPNSAAWKPASRPVPKVLAGAVKSRRQRDFVTVRRETAAAYDLTAAGGQQVLLFVVQTRHAYAVQSPPFVTRLTGVSGGMSVAAWQKDGTLYVLAVREEDGQKLDNFIRQQPLAQHFTAGRAARPA